MFQALSVSAWSQVGRVKSDAQAKALVLLRFRPRATLIESQRCEHVGELARRHPTPSSRTRARARAHPGGRARALAGRVAHRHARCFETLSSVCGKSRENFFTRQGVGGI